MVLPKVSGSPVKWWLATEVQAALCCLPQRPDYRTFLSRNSRITGMISLPWVSRAKCPVS